jgi:hypothetical protein
MKAYGGVDVRFFDLGTSWRRMVTFTALPLYPGQRTPSTYSIGGYVDLCAGLDDIEKLKIFDSTGIRTPTPNRPARSQSLYRVRYRGSE